MTHQELVEQVEQAIGELFSDTSVDQATTKESLGGIIEELEMLIETLNP